MVVHLHSSCSRDGLVAGRGRRRTGLNRVTMTFMRVHMINTMTVRVTMTALPSQFSEIVREVP